MDNKDKCVVFVVVVLFWGSISVVVESLEFIEWGHKCQVPKSGGDEPSTVECDAAKGLYCNGEACVCTFSQRYSYDPVSRECRRKVGQSCQYVDTTQGLEPLLALPFNLKCHENAECQQVKVGSKISASESGAPDLDVEVEEVSMCVCRPGFYPTNNFDNCDLPQPTLDWKMVHMPLPKRPFLKNKYEDLDEQDY